jgi:hypothetical protein
MHHGQQAGAMHFGPERRFWLGFSDKNLLFFSELA